MDFIKTGASALGKLLTVAALAAAFFVGLIGVVYLSLRGEEIKVPELIGKDYYSSEKEIENLGLKLKKRATRYSEEKPNTVLEQLPKPGETVKTGQTILVVLSEANPEGNEAPVKIKKEPETSEEDEGTDIAPEKPVRSNKNSNVKKPSQTTRDVISNKSNKNANTDSSDSNKKSDNTNSKSESNDDKKSTGNKNSSTAPSTKATPESKPKTETVKPTPAKTPTSTSGETRTRKVQPQ